MTAAGVCIGIAAGVYVGCPDRVAGALLFSVGLLCVIANRLSLFTGHVGFADANPETWAYFATMLTFNFLGAGLTGWILYATGDRLPLIAQGIVTAKLSRPWTGTLAGGVICGACMYLAVLPWREQCKQALSTAITIMAVAAFILMGGEHCIADLAFLCIAGGPPDNYPSTVLPWLWLAVAGNAIGALGMRWLVR